MANVSNMHLEKAVEFLPSKVFEIQRIQENFVRMKFGLWSFSKFVPTDVVRQVGAAREFATGRARDIPPPPSHA